MCTVLQVDKINSRIKQLKRQLDDAEEECTRMTALKRKVQRDLDEAVEQNDVLHRDNEQLRAKLRIGGASDKLRCVCRGVKVYLYRFVCVYIGFFVFI